MQTRSFALIILLFLLFTAAGGNGQESSEGKSGSAIRRVVTGTNAAGKSAVIFDGVPPNIIKRPRGAGGEFDLLWFTSAMPADNSGNQDATLGRSSTNPPPNGSSFHIVEWEPGEGLTSEPAGSDMGSAEHSGESGMHRTKTIDYVVILSGAINMRMGDSSEAQLKAGDVLVQRGVYHKWINRGTVPCRAAMIQIPSTPFKD